MPASSMNQSSLWSVTGTISENFVTGNSPNWAMHKESCSKFGYSPSLLKQLTPLIHRLKQVGQMLGYNKGEVLEILKKSLATRYYYLLFSIQNLEEANESTKRVLTKEKLVKQLAIQNSTT